MTLRKSENFFTISMEKTINMCYHIFCFLLRRVTTYKKVHFFDYGRNRHHDESYLYAVEEIIQRG